MKKIILGFILFISLFFSGITANVALSGSSKNYVIEEVQEVGREYVFKESQWYLYIYYSDGSIGVYPCVSPPDF
jgi:hypothetical protein